MHYTYLETTIRNTANAFENTGAYLPQKRRQRKGPGERAKQEMEHAYLGNATYASEFQGYK